MLDLLRGVRVISFNHFLLGPVGMQALGDLGADVISVEPLDGAFQRRFAGAGTYVDGQSACSFAGTATSAASPLTSNRMRDGPSSAGSSIERTWSARIFARG